MNADQIYVLVKDDILMFGYPTYNMDYWKGYCNAVEQINKLPKNSLWIDVKFMAKNLCDKQIKKLGEINIIKVD